MIIVEQNKIHRIALKVDLNKFPATKHQSAITSESTSSKVIHVLAKTLQLPVGHFLFNKIGNVMNIIILVYKDTFKQEYPDGAELAKFVWVNENSIEVAVV